MFQGTDFVRMCARQSTRAVNVLGYWLLMYSGTYQGSKCTRVLTFENVRKAKQHNISLFVDPHQVSFFSPNISLFQHLSLRHL